MFDAGRQPLATLQFNTPEQKRSVKVRKHADVFFCPRAVNPWANPAQSPIKVKDVSKTKRSVEVPKQIADVFFSPNTTSAFGGDDDITTGSSTLRRVPRVKQRAGPKDSCDLDDEDLPLCRVKELMIKLGRPPAIRFVPPPFKHTLLRPATIPMECIASNCPFDWHTHVNAASH
ncbi:hypothetical protein JOM56_007937 [Amanita muscaria]